MATLPAIGLGTVFTLISFAPFLPAWMKRPEGPHTTVWIGAGTLHLDDTSDKTATADARKKASFGGSEPNLSLFTNAGTRIGTYHSSGVIGEEKTQELHVKHWDEKGGLPAASYISVSAGGWDAICINQVSVLDPTGAEGAGDFRFVPGEMAKECNQWGKDYPWYPSDKEMEIKTDDRPEPYHEHPACLMIDKEKKGAPASVPYQGFTVRLQDFSKANTHFKEWEGDLRHMCDSEARFMMYKQLSVLQCPDMFATPNTPAGALLPLKTTPMCHPDVHHPDLNDPKCQTDKPNPDECPYSLSMLNSKTGINPNSGWRRDSNRKQEAREAAAAMRKRTPFHEMLVKSSIEEHSAVEVCGDLATVGPHFYSTQEQMFCETDTHTLYPSCEKDEAVDCFDPTTDRLTFANGTTIQERDGEVGYRSVKNWSPRPGRRRLIRRSRR
ncbi:MAG: hypothetical protein Q9160_006901 [Pyrenula sp. 1 TL-2023]